MTNQIIKLSTGQFKTKCGKYEIIGACMGLKGMGMRQYQLINSRSGRVLRVGSLASCKKQAAYCASVDSESSWEPVSQSEHEEMMAKEKGLRSII
jgi:hypothetical protein